MFRHHPTTKYGIMTSYSVTCLLDRKMEVILVFEANPSPRKADRRLVTIQVFLHVFVRLLCDSGAISLEFRVDRASCTWDCPTLVVKKFRGCV